MAANDENYVLVCMSSSGISRVVRSYLSRRRAEEDLELLREMDPATSYEVQAVEYIDN